uniref:non-specific serine/threonine protein kinase n=1 Tax=Leersia perrieri TaxID=77586 RepID=A0A0D9XWK6_9ORYZ
MYVKLPKGSVDMSYAWTSVPQSNLLKSIHDLNCIKRGLKPEEVYAIQEGLKVMTNHFQRYSYKDQGNYKDVLGRGRSGIVYNGVLDDGWKVAIKRLETVWQGEQEFQAMLCVIGRINYMNLVRIWGFCSESSHRMLVSEYIENGSLASVLFNNNILLQWAQRFKIALGVAKGLAYLHHECLEWVIHCDVTPKNIFLDQNLEPKISDFGLAKLLDRGGSNPEMSWVRETIGYIAPEWVSGLPIIAKVDVYSNGVVLFELVSGTRISDLARDEDELMPMVLGNLVLTLVDRLDREDLEWIARLLIKLAISCLEEDTKRRPTMESIAQRRWKKPVDSARTRLEGRTRDHRLDKLMIQLKNLRLALDLHGLISQQRNGYASLQLLSRWRHEVGLNIEIGAFLRKYPHIFDVYVHPIKRNECCKLTPKMADLIAEEDAVIRENEPAIVKRLKKLLMLSTDRTLNMHALWLIRRELGLPDDYRCSILQNHQSDFSLCSPDTLTLVTKDENLAVADTKYAFPINFPTGFRIEKGFREKLGNWQRLPYTKAYEKNELHPVRNVDRLEKHIVGILHELLSLTVQKMIPLERLSHFRRPFDMEVNLRELILKHPGIFYISTKGSTPTVLLRESYSKGCLVEPNPVYNVRRKMLGLILAGCRGIDEMDSAIQFSREYNQESSNKVSSGDDLRRLYKLRKPAFVSNGSAPRKKELVTESFIKEQSLSSALYIKKEKWLIRREPLERLSHFRRPFNMEVNLRELILKHPGIFYISTKGSTPTVLLRESYSKGCLVDPNPVYNVRRKMLGLILAGCRGIDEMDSAIQFSGEYNQESSNESLNHMCHTNTLRI